MAWSCKDYFSFLFRESPNFDKDILRDWFPTDDAWIGHVSTMPWEPFTGVEHTVDKTHIGAPDLSQTWQTLGATSGNCMTNACTPTAISVGWGSTRFTYAGQKQRYQTNVLCFDEMITYPKAKEQLSRIISGLKDLSKMIWSDYIRANSLMQAETIYIAGAAQTEVPITGSTFTGNMNTIALGSEANLPTSNLTIQYLQKFYEPLQAGGYFKSKFVPDGMFKLITDVLTSQQLIEGNPALTGMFQFNDFAKGGALFKYGMSKAIGNYGIAWDDSQARFYHVGGGLLQRVYKYVNANATVGIKPTVNQYWIDAPYAYSSVWHPEAMKRMTFNMTSINPEMPFLTRDLGGKWNFTGPESDSFVVTDPTTGTTCVIDNKARNQGIWWADFESGFRPEQMDKWTRGILHLREPGCVVDQVPCSTAPAYVDQSWSDVNPVCAA